MLKTLAQIIIWSAILVTPLLILPMGPNIFISPKALWLLFLTLLTIIVWSITQISRHQISLTLHPFTFPLLMMIASVLITAYFTRQHFSVIGLDMVVSQAMLAILALLLPSLLHIKDTKPFISGLLFVGMIYTLIGFLQQLGIGPSHLIAALFQISLPHTLAFSLAGSPLNTFALLLVLLIPTLIQLVISAAARRSLWQYTAAFIIAAGLGLYGLQMLPKHPFSPTLLPFTNNWMIAAEMFKLPVPTFFGTGTDRFVNAYTRFRPAEMNKTQLWNVQFQAGRTTPLHLLIVSGLLGFSAWFWLFFQSLKAFKYVSAQSLPAFCLVWASFAVQLFLPMNILLTLIQMLGIVLIASHLETIGKTKELTIQTVRHITISQPVTIVVPGIIGICIIIIASYLGWSMFHMTLGNVALFRAQQALERNDGTKTYQFQQTALKHLPYNDAFQRTYGLTNLALASSLSQKSDISEEDRTIAAQLIQQAIRSAKNASQLNPGSSQNWKALATVYQQLAGVAQGADQWAIAAYVRAIETDPTNPELRAQLGNVFLKAKQYTQAQQLFEQTIQLKNDWPTGYAFLGNALKLQNKPELALVAYREALEYVEPSSDMAISLQQEIQHLEELPEKTPSESSSASEPVQEPSPLSVLNTPEGTQSGQLQLPADAGIPTVSPEDIPEIE